MRKILNLLKPKPVQQKIFADMRPRSAFSAPLRVNLGRRRAWRFDLREGAKVAASLAAIWSLILGSAAAPAIAPLANATSAGDERADLEKQLQQLEGQITQYQGQISAYQKQGKSLSGEIAKLNAQIAKVNLQIKAVNLSLAQLNTQINSTQLKIQDLEEQIGRDEGHLAEVLRNLERTESASIIEVLLKNTTLSDFFGDISNMSELQSSLRSTISEIKDLHDQLTDKKQQLTIAKADAETIKKFQENQKLAVASTKTQKAELLSVTKGQESKYQALLKDTAAQAAKIRSRLFELLGGGSMSFGQAYQFAKIAGSATGVRPAFLLAVLDHESALGKNVGQCSYHTAMNPKDQPTFIAITTALGIDPEVQKVSCPNADGAYGGAMGPAQFIPSTWKAYAPGIANITGKAAANPWNNQDAFIAAGLYLRDAGASTNERMAAAKYYCGGNWNRYVCTQVYGERVIEKAASFQADINVLEGNS